MKEERARGLQSPFVPMPSADSPPDSQNKPPPSPDDVEEGPSSRRAPEIVSIAPQGDLLHGTHKAQRRQQNQLNAQHSTGPKTEQGKNIARCNSFVHGMAAQVLALPTEKPEEIASRSRPGTRPASPRDSMSKHLSISLPSARSGWDGSPGPRPRSSPSRSGLRRWSRIAARKSGS